MSFLMNIGSGIALSVVFFAAYVEISPKMGGIWIRPDEKMRKKFIPSNLVNLMLQPFHNKDFWKMDILPINWVVHASTIVALLMIKSKYANDPSI